MGSKREVLTQEYIKMMTDMIVLCVTLALSLFFWVVSLTVSAVSGEPNDPAPFLSFTSCLCFSLSQTAEQI